MVIVVGILGTFSLKELCLQLYKRETVCKWVGLEIVIVFSLGCL